MAESALSLNPVFLSASVPDPKRDKKYFESGNSVLIRDAVIALVTVVLPRGKLVFGGHPAIAPMVKWVADRLEAFERVRVFQSKYFQEFYLRDLESFRYEETEVQPGGREPSLEHMRREMLLSEKSFAAAFFIGGMEGVEQEFGLITEIRPEVPRFPVATTGAAAKILLGRELDAIYLLPRELQSLRRAQLNELETRTSYAALFSELLGYEPLASEA
jgi:hypothetical protein